MSGSVSFLSIGGAVLSDVSTSVFIDKLNLPHVFETPVLGGHVGLTATLPIAWGSLDFGGELNSGLTGSLSDQEFGTGDLTLTPSIGWSDGHFHGAAAISLFLPTGKYSDASVDLATRSVTALNFGKNRLA